MSDSAAAGTFLLTEDLLDDWSFGAAWPLGLDLAQPGVDVPSRLPTPNCNYRFKIQNGEPRVPESRFPPPRSAPDTSPNRLSAVGMTRMKKLIGAETSCGGRGSRARAVREPPLRKSRSMAAISCGVTDCPLGGLRPSIARSGYATVFSPPRSAPDTSPYHLSADFEESMSVFLGGDLLLGTRLDTVVCAIHSQEWLCYGLSPPRSAPDTSPNRLSAVGMTRMKELIGSETPCGGRGSRARAVREPPLRKSRSMAAISCGVTDCPRGLTPIHSQEWLCYGLFAPSQCPRHFPISSIGGF